jgi:glycosyltransferase involved in cell wall biosynthesis
MRIAYFSPLPPKRTGIATYSKHMLKALASKVDLEVFDHGETEDIGLPVHDYEERPSLLSIAEQCDACIYHFGNNPSFHSRIREVALRLPGVVVLHDAVLYFLAAGRGPGGLLREMQACSTEPSETLAKSIAFCEEVPDGNVLRHPRPEAQPVLRSVISSARKLLVHGETTAKLAREAGYEGSIGVVPLLCYPDAYSEVDKTLLPQIRTKLGVGPDDFLVGCFGFVASTKRPEAILRAIAQLVKRGLPVKLMVVGIGEDIVPLVRKYGLKDRIITLGFVSDSEFQELLAAVDAVVNLRYPSMGEASATLVQALAHDKPCVVTDHGWFAEWSQDHVSKVSCGENEAEEVSAILSSWIKNPKAARAMGVRAGNFVRERHHPDRVASMYLGAAEENANISKTRLSGSNIRSDSAAWMANHLADRTRQVIGDVV